MRIPSFSHTSKILIALIAVAAIALCVVLLARSGEQFGKPSFEQIGRSDVKSQGPDLAARSDKGKSASERPKFQLAPLPAAFNRVGKKPIHDALVDLRNAALRGSGSAARDAFDIEAFCSTSDVLQAAMRNVKASSSSTNPIVIEAFQAQMSRVDDVCAGVTPAQRMERFDNIRIAAELGERGAAADFLAVGPARDTRSDLSSDGRLDPTIATEQWRQSALSYLSRDVAVGDVSAMLALAEALRSGTLATADPTTALALVIAVGNIKKPENGDVPLRYREMASTYARSIVSQSDQQRAQELASQIVQKCCSKDNRGGG